eukprot:gene1132-11604_t
MPGIYEDDDDVPLMDGLSGSGPPSAPVSILNQSGLTDTGYFPATPSWGGGSMGFGSQRLSFSSMGKSAHSQTPRGSPKFGSPPGPDSWFRRRTGGSVVSNSAAVGNDGLEASFAEEGSPGSGGGGGGGEGRMQAASTPRRKYNSETFSRSRPGSPEPSHVPDTPPNGSKSELAAVGAPSSPSSATTTPLNTSTVGEFDEVMGNGKGHKFFVPYIGSLTKLVLFSSVVHQTAFSLKSTLPFAIDAGLIFLSTMASNIVNHMLNEKTHTDEAILATVLCWLAMSTALLGCALWLTGKLQLAAMVQYLPMPVIGGYAGLKMMTGVDEITGLFKRATINGTHHPEIHAQNMDNLILLAPGVTLGAVLLLVLQRFRHFAVLPCMLISIPTIYYIVMFATGLSFEEARAAHGYGWLANATVEDGSNVTTADDFWDGWKDYKFAQIHWHALPRQLPTWLAMYFVVAFSSSLDVAAIQMELGKPLDFNHELKTVGISNIASGLTGGFTGSYIFSQTIFTMRAGIRTRWIGAVLSTFMAIAFTIPISILAFVPRFFFGAILSLIAARHGDRDWDLGLPFRRTVRANQGFKLDDNVVQSGPQLPRARVALKQPELNRRVGTSRKLATKYLLIDFGSVTGLDATAARSLFATLLQLLNLYSIKLIITAANSSVDKILRMHGIITDENADMVRVFETADEGLEWCEEELLARLARRPDRNTTVLELEDSSTTSMQALKQILQANMDEDQIDALDLISKTHILEKYFKKIKLQKGDPIFDEGKPHAPAMTWVDRSRLIPARWKPSRIGSQYLPRKVRVLRYDAGGIIGELDFTLRQPRSFSSEALENTVVYVLSRDDFSTMEKEHPQIAIGVQHRLLTSLSVSATSLLSHR